MPLPVPPFLLCTLRQNALSLCPFGGRQFACSVLPCPVAQACLYHELNYHYLLCSGSSSSYSFIYCSIFASCHLRSFTTLLMVLCAVAGHSLRPTGTGCTLAFGLLGKEASAICRCHHAAYSAWSSCAYSMATADQFTRLSL